MIKVLSKRQALEALCGRWRKEGRAIGFVPTMGALHEGHAALIRRARRENRKVVVSIFVNPAQFGPREDYGRYPRPFAADKKLCAACGVDAIYRPTIAEIYPRGYGTHVEVSGLSDILDGVHRPGHFKGVATVVLKLLLTAQPHRAYFGEKDYQQLLVIRKMSADLNLPLAIVAVPTVRAKDGLALSSRNRYLTPAQRAAAPRLYAALKLGARTRLLSQVRREIKKIPGVSIDYVSLVDAKTLEKTKGSGRKLRLLAAIRLGKTRLIDNIPVSR